MQIENTFLNDHITWRRIS